MMKKYLQLFGLLFLMLTSTSIVKGEYIIAVLNFQNNSGNSQLAYLENAVPEMLITSLVASPKITIVERTKIQNILDEHKLSLSGAIDEKMAVEIGKLLGAKQLLYGSIFGAYDALRLDARICAATDGKILVADKVDMSDGLDLIELIDALAVKLISGLTNENISINYPEDKPETFEPKDGKVIAVTCGADNLYRLKDSTAPSYLLINLVAGKMIKQQERIPLNICMVLDKSGSMGSEDKLENVKKAALFVVDNLNKNDYFSLVTYDTHVYTPFISQLVMNKNSIKSIISEIMPGSSTNLSGGLLEGYAQVESHFKKGYVNRELLLTDGLANTGITNPQQLKQIVTEKNHAGCTLSTFGVGSHFNEDMLTTLAEFGGANYYFIDSPEKIADIFSNELQGLLSVVAQNVKLEIDLSPGVNLIDVFGYAHQKEGNKIKVKLNDIFSEETKSVLLKFDVPNLGAAKLSVCSATLTYDDVAVLNKRITEKFSADIKITEDESLVKKHVNTMVYENIALYESTKLLDEAISLIDKRDFEEAKKSLEKNISYLQSNMNPNSSKRLKQQMLNVAKYSNENEKVEEMGEQEIQMMQKSVKYDNYRQKKKK